MRHTKKENEKAVKKLLKNSLQPLTVRERIVIWIADHPKLSSLITRYRFWKLIRGDEKVFDKQPDAKTYVAELRKKTKVAEVSWQDATDADGKPTHPSQKAGPRIPPEHYGIGVDGPSGI